MNSKVSIILIAVIALCIIFSATFIGSNQGAAAGVLMSTGLSQGVSLLIAMVGVLAALFLPGIARIIGVLVVIFMLLGSMETIALPEGKLSIVEMNGTIRYAMFFLGAIVCYYIFSRSKSSSA